VALTKADMAEKLFEELGLNKREAKELVEMFFEEVRSALDSGDQVKLSASEAVRLWKLRPPKQKPKARQES
jgi:integration host factor subunit alpha